MTYFIGNQVSYLGIESANIEELLEYFSDKDSIGFDTETTGFDPYIDYILAYQLGDDKNQFVVDALQYPIELVEDLLLSKELIIHNVKFDIQFLYAKGIYPTKVWDTYLGECVLNKGDKTVRKSLEITVYRYFQYQLTKTTRGKIFREKFSEKVIRYCAEDVEFLGRIKSIQQVQLRRLDLVNSMSLENEFVKVLAYIEYSGIKLDVDSWTKKIMQDRDNCENSLRDLNKWLIENNIYRFIDAQLDMFNPETKTTINWDSPKQVVELFQSLGINTHVADEKTGDLKDSVDSSVLEKQIDKSPIIPIYLTYKKFDKTLSTYGESFLNKINKVTGRIHTSFTQIMDTGRLSCGGKKGEKDTINLQNIPRLPSHDEKVEGKIYERECFIPEHDNVFIDADYSGQEQVVFANWTLDPDILKFYDDQLGDMHSFIASKIFPYLKDVPLPEIKSKYKNERQIAKSAGFAINYGGDGSTISNNLNIAKEEGEEIYLAYFRAFPGVSQYFKKATDQALRDGYILFNDISKSKCFISFFDKYKNYESKIRHSGFWEKYREEKESDSLLYRRELKPLVSRYFKLRGNISRMALNYPIQGSSAEITKLACIYIFEYIVKNNLTEVVKFVNVIHDEILLECPTFYMDTMKFVVEDCMTRAGNAYCKRIPLKAEVEICIFWDH